MRTPLILDLDRSLAGLGDVSHVPLNEWQDRIRFGCGWAVWQAFAHTLQQRMPDEYGTVCFGSGDFHHLSHLLIQRMPQDRQIDVVVCDNHPDNMRFPFGIHCGSWVRHVAALPYVRRVEVVGIGSADVSWAHAWENHLMPLYRGRVRYWTLGVDTRWARRLGLGGAVRSFARKEELIASFTEALQSEKTPVYFSIDKDVLAEDVARTNWDQGSLTLQDLQSLIAVVSGRVIGSDITGEVSIHHYQARWKRVLSALDAQPTIAEKTLAIWQTQQIEANRFLLGQLAAASLATN